MLRLQRIFHKPHNVSDMNKAEYGKNQILAILERIQLTCLTMVRFYMNEMVIYGLQQTMRDGNNRVKRIR